MADVISGEFDLIRRDQIGLPEFKGPSPYGCLISDRAQNETAVGLEVVIFKKHLAPFQRKIVAVNKVLMKFIAFGIDVINPITILTVDREQDVRQSIGSVGIVNDGEGVEFGARLDH